MYRVKSHSSKLHILIFFEKKVCQSQNQHDISDLFLVARFFLPIKWLNKNMYTFFLQKAKCTVKSHLSSLVSCHIDLNFYFFWCFCVNSSCNKCHKYEPQSIQLNETNGFEYEKQLLFFN